MDVTMMDAYEEWLRTFRWTHFATGTWTDAISPTAALATAHRWVKKAGHEAYAVVGVQKGRIRLATHVHLLVGGISELQATHLRGSWIRDGQMQMVRFTPTRGGV